jgi:hypothetical protein
VVISPRQRRILPQVRPLQPHMRKHDPIWSQHIILHPPSVNHYREGKAEECRLNE